MSFLGRGIRASKRFLKGSFLLQYCGELTSAAEGKMRDTLDDSVFRFYFDFAGKKWW